jgi:cobalt-precorrin 5A hydrolase
MVLGEAMMVAGIGCRKGVGADEVLAAVQAALDHFSAERKNLDALATAVLKLGEGGIVAASQRLDLPLRIVGSAELKAAESRTVTSSVKTRDLTGVGSVSEAAALAAAGPGSILLGPRVVVGPVACALAVGGEAR